jgi:hypothetical protein
VAALGANCPFTGFLDPFGAYVKGAGVAFCEDSGIVDHVLVELQMCVDCGGKDATGMTRAHIIMMAKCPSGTNWTALATHPRAGLVITLCCDMIRAGGTNNIIMGPRLINVIIHLCERNEHPAGRYAGLQHMVGQQEGLVDAVLDAIGDQDHAASWPPQSLLCRLLGYCAMTCDKSYLPRMADASYRVGDDPETVTAVALRALKVCARELRRSVRERTDTNAS